MWGRPNLAAPQCRPRSKGSARCKVEGGLGGPPPPNVDGGHHFRRKYNFAIENAIFCPGNIWAEGACFGYLCLDLFFLTPIALFAFSGYVESKALAFIGSPFATTVCFKGSSQAFSQNHLGGGTWTSLEFTEEYCGFLLLAPAACALGVGGLFASGPFHKNLSRFPQKCQRSRRFFIFFTYRCQKK